MSQRVGGRPRARRRLRDTVMTLAVPSGVRVRVSLAGFGRLCRANTDLRLERTARGELVIMPPAGTESGSRNAGLTAQLWNWNDRTGLGVVFDSSAGFTLPNTAVRSPDATWMNRARWDALPPEEREKFARVCPDFVVELRSRSDRMKDLRDKMREYLDQGVRLGWLLNPKVGAVEIYHPGQPVIVLKRPKTLSGEDVLPGFVLDLKGILFE